MEPDTFWDQNGSLQLCPAKELVLYMGAAKNKAALADNTEAQLLQESD